MCGVCKVGGITGKKMHFKCSIKSSELKVQVFDGKSVPTFRTSSKDGLRRRMLNSLVIKNLF